MSGSLFISLDEAYDGKEAVLEAIAHYAVQSGYGADPQQVYDALIEREEMTSTAFADGIAIPHCKSAAVTQPGIVFLRLKTPVQAWGQQPVDLVFGLLAPEGADSEHLKMLSRLAKQLVKKDFIASLRMASTAQQCQELLSQALGEIAVQPAAADASSDNVSANASAAVVPAKKIVAVTACPTGIAHTYIAADKLAEAAAAAGMEIKVETQGSGGFEPLTQEEIDGADAVIFAADIEVRGRGRFVGKKVLRTTVSEAVNNAPGLIERAFSAEVMTGRRSAAAAPVKGLGIKNAVLTGVSYMIPFVAAGGIMIALGFMFAGWQIDKTATKIVSDNALWNLPEGGLLTYLGALLFFIGVNSMSFLVPALSGYIAYGIADRPGIAPGFTVGVIAVALKSGYLGGLAGGIIAGLIALVLSRLQTPRWLRGLMPVVIIPLLATLAASAIMIIFLGVPIAWFMDYLNNFLSGFSGSSSIILGAILGAMMCFDLGGPINKVAYAFATAGLLAGSMTNQVPWMIMAAVMASGMVPPLGMALATLLRPGMFSAPERENGKSAWLLGAAFISEGAIPFAAADPLRVIASSMLGGMATGAIAFVSGVTSPAPHGGIFVAPIIGNLLMFFIAILVGTVITALVFILLKTFVRSKKLPA